MAEIRNLTRNGETFYPLTTSSAVINEATGEGLVIDNEPTYRSNNLVKSDGIWVDLSTLGINIDSILEDKPFIIHDCLMNIPSNFLCHFSLNLNYDCAIVKIFEGSTKITLYNPDNNNYQPTKRYFGYLDFSEDAEIPQLHSGNSVREGDKYCVINFKKSDNPNGIENIKITQDNKFIHQNEFSEEIESRILGDESIKNTIINTFDNNLEIVKNLINVNDVLYGYGLSEGQWIYTGSDLNITSNKLYFKNGYTYALQGILQWSTYHAIYFACFDSSDNYLGRFYINATYGEGERLGKAIFTYNDNIQGTSYCRVVLQNASNVYYDPTVCQIEVGNTYTPVSSYAEVLKYIPNTHSISDAYKKKIRLLSIGNSYSQDALSYVPFILQNMGVDADIQIGILVMSSSSLSNHVSNFNNETAAYKFYYHSGGTSWQSVDDKTIQWVLDNYDWDIITLQQSSGSVFTWSTYQPYLNQLINLIGGYVNYQVKFGWYAVQARPATSNSGSNWDDATITSHYESIAENSQKVMNQTVCEFLVPVDTAIQNARTIASIKSLGAYSDNPLNTSGLGYLTPNDGVHLQEGLPCQIAAYTFILAILKLYGFENYSIIGETTRVTAEWAAGKSIPGPHGDYIGSTDANCLMAQLSVVMAIKNPYEVTDMNYIINPI